MITLLIAVYLIGFAATTVGLYGAGRHFGSTNRLPTQSTLNVALIGGGVWPLLLVGAMEAAAVVAFSRSIRDDAERTEQVDILV